MRKLYILGSIITLLYWSGEVVGVGWTNSTPLFVEVPELTLSPHQYEGLVKVRNRPEAVDIRVVKIQALNQLPDIASTSSIRVNLYPNRDMVPHHDRTVSYGKDEFTWVGTLSAPGSSVILTIAGSSITGWIWTGEQSYGIWPLGGGFHAIYRVDAQQFPPDHPPGAAHHSPSSALTGGYSSRGKKIDNNMVSLNTESQTLYTYDLLVVYTPAAKDSVNGSTAMSGLIRNAYQQSNVIYKKSGAAVRDTVMHKEEVNYTESSSMETDWSRLVNPSDGYMDNVHDPRDQYYADIVVLITGSGDYCGYSGVIQATKSTAFAVVKWNCAVEHMSFTHEIGHLFGAEHEWGYDIDQDHPYRYNHAFTNTSANFQTVLALKAQKTIPRILYLSTPNKTYNGYTIGSADREDNTRVHTERASDISSFYGDGLPPAPPTNLYISGNVGGYPRINWTASSNPDVVRYELFRRTYTYPTWGLYATTTNTYYVDSDYVISNAYDADDQYFYKVRAVDSEAFRSEFSNTDQVYGKDQTPYPYGDQQQVDSLQVHAIERPRSLPEVYSLGPNYPNPFTRSTTIRYTLPKASQVTLAIYDIAGRKVSTLVSERQPARVYTVEWDGKNAAGQSVAPGVYIYRLHAKAITEGNIDTQMQKLVKT